MCISMAFTMEQNLGGLLLMMNGNEHINFNCLEGVKEEKKNLKIVHLASEADTLFNIEYVKAEIEKFKAAGFKPIFKTAKYFTHYPVDPNCWNYVKQDFVTMTNS